MFWLLLNSVCTASGIPLFPYTPKASRLGGGQDAVKGHHLDSRPELTKGYSMLRNVTLRKKNSGQGGGRVDVRGHGVCLPKQVLCVLGSCLPGSVRTPVC